MFNSSHIALYPVLIPSFDKYFNDSLQHSERIEL